MKCKQIVATAVVGLGLVSVLTGCTVERAADDDDNGNGGAGGQGVGGGTATPEGLPVLGNFEHAASSVNLTALTTAADGLSVPRDAQFHPMRPNELWVVNRATNSVSILVDPGSPQQNMLLPTGLGSNHFLAQPSSIALGQNGLFATIHETDDLTQGPDGTPEDFMGPTLWTDNLAEFEGGHASHYDMLHNSPNGMGIAWQRDSVYWVFDGYHSSISMYDFAADHGPGGADHSDGVMRRYVEGEVLWVENVPSHMEFHPTQRNLLYIADTGHNRIAVLDTDTGTPGAIITPNYDGGEQNHVTGASITTLVDGAAIGMAQPSGLAIHNDVIYVADAGNSVIWAFSMDGELLDWLETGLPLGSTQGLDLDASGNIAFADPVSNTLWSVSPLQ